jgi:hypothetical protein
MLSPEQKAGSQSQPMPEGNAASLMKPTSSPVPTVSDYQEKDVVADDK